MPVDAPIYPVSLVLRAKRCLVVGGGHVAARKAAGLVEAQGEVHVVAREVLAPMRQVTGLALIEERPYRKGEAAGYWLAVAATGDPVVNQVVYDDGEEAGVWVNSADDPERCSLILPAVARQGPVSVAVSTGGYSPALASWLKAHVVEHMGPEVAVLAQLLATERARLQDSGRSTADVDWRSALGWDMLELIRQGRHAEVKERLEACLSQ